MKEKTGEGVQRTPWGQRQYRLSPGQHLAHWPECSKTMARRLVNLWNSQVLTLAAGTPWLTLAASPASEHTHCIHVHTVSFPDLFPSFNLLIYKRREIIIPFCQHCWKNNEISHRKAPANHKHIHRHKVPSFISSSHCLKVEKAKKKPAQEEEVPSLLCCLHCQGGVDLHRRTLKPSHRSWERKMPLQEGNEPQGEDNWKRKNDV